MNIQGLIERYEKFKASKKKLTSVDLVLKDLRSLDEPEPLPFKLKDVVRRIRGFDPTTQTRWLNDILKELGDDYGSMKYRSGYEQGKLEGMVEREKVKVPQFIAEFITEQKKLGHTLSYSIDASMSDRVAEWYWDNSESFALAWILGYEVEEEKRYLVRIKGVEEDNAFLNYYVPRNEWFMDSACDMGDIRAFHTRKKLEEAGFGEVFNSPLFEVLEVE